ncbi:ribonuclease P [Candidatus Woesearchaeota archaeon]|nr:ribonuclease P [Candidatus Woesearchaeota archaeon]
MKKKRAYKSKPKEQVDTANKRIAELFSQAEQVFDEDPKLADRYVEIARKISMKIKVRIPSSLKKRFCKHCYCYLVPGKNCRVRTHEGKVVYYCMQCKKYMRFPYK